MPLSPPVVLISPEEAPDPVPIVLIEEARAAETLRAGERLAGLAEASDFTGKAGQVLIEPGADGRPRCVYFGVGSGAGPMSLRGLPTRLPPGVYSLGAAEDLARVLAFHIGSYRFDRYRKEPGTARPRLVVTDAGVRREAARRGAADALVRDLVNTPASDLGPEEIETAARAVAAAASACVTVTSGDELLEAGYPAVHAVGRAAGRGRAPRLIEIAWDGPGADARSPLVAVIGKGVSFDSGGLDIKPSSGMRWMKKDMGGAAHALGLAALLMAEPLKLRLRVLIAAVENSISGDAMRPGDVLASRAGLSIEVGNTDAEGRLILADALTRAGEFEPDLTITLATLTGAARVALGPEVVPFYTGDDDLAAELAAAAALEADPLWRLPLWDGYESSLDSDIADLKNDPDPWAQAGSVTAGLFLRRFAPKTGAFLHFDLYAWNPRARPGAPVGAEAQGLRALHRVVSRRGA